MTNELDFTASDFLADRPIDIELRETFPEWKKIITSLAAHHAKRANEILHEKLAKAPEVFAVIKRQKGSMRIKNLWGRTQAECDTHRALLIGIEEIK